jgi:hypothetical protein
MRCDRLPVRCQRCLPADEAGMTSVYEYAWCRDSGQTVACTVVRRGPLTVTRSAELHR